MRRLRRVKQQSGFTPEQLLRDLRLELLQLDARIDEALDDRLLESLLYERMSLYSRMGAVIEQAKQEREQRKEGEAL